MMFRRIATTTALALVGFSLPASAETAASKVDAPVASTIAYNLPSMSVTVAVDLTLKDCTGTPVITPDVTITPVTGPESHPVYHFVLDAAYLQSFSRDKNLSVETYPNGTLKTINGGATDQTGTILTSIIKFAASLLAMAGPANEQTTPKGVCNAATMSALHRVKALTGAIDTIRGVPKPGDPTRFVGDLVSGDPEKIRHAQDAITALATEIARIQTTDLRVTLPPTTYVLDSAHTGMHIPVTLVMLKKWIDAAPGSAQVKLTDLALGLCALKADDVAKAGTPTCDANVIEGGLTYLRTHSEQEQGQPTGNMAVEQPNCDGGPACPRTLVFREPVNAVVVVVPEGSGYAKGHGTILARQDMAISQWGTLSYVPIKAGFGKSITFGMSFDAAGHKLSQSWSYKARGAGIFGAASSVADASSTLYKGIDGRSLAEKKAELDELTTDKNLNQIRLCKAVIDAGGFTCPTQ